MASLRFTHRALPALLAAAIAGLMVPTGLRAQRAKVEALATFELGHVNSVGPFAGIGAELATLWPQFEARVSFNRMGRAGGCIAGGGCELGDVELWELALGILAGHKRGSARGWALGIGVGSALEKYDQRRIASSLYIARTWQPVGRLSVRIEGKLRALKDTDGNALSGRTIKLGVGVTSD